MPRPFIQPDTHDRSDTKQRSRELATAFMYLNTPDDIATDALVLREIARDPEQKASDRINAVKTILEYSISKPKQELDVTTNDESLNTNLDLTKLSDVQLRELKTIAESLGDTKGIE